MSKSKVFKNVGELHLDIYKTGKKQGFFDGVMAFRNLISTNKMSNKEFNKFLKISGKLIKEYKP